MWTNVLIVDNFRNSLSPTYAQSATIRTASASHKQSRGLHVAVCQRQCLGSGNAGYLLLYPPDFTPAIVSGDIH